MKYTKMWLDGKPTQNPQSTTRINKNLVISAQIGSWVNEKGFVKSKTLDLTPIGIIPLDRNDFVVFSTNDATSEIGYFDNNENYTIINNGTLWKFNKNYPIHGEFYRNNKNEVVISWVDDINTPKTLNINDLPVLLNETSASTFPYTHEPKITTYLTENGGLKSGSYIPICRYIGYDNSTTSWIKSYNPVYVTSSNEGNIYQNYQGVKSGELTNKSIKFNFQNINPNYKYLEIGLIYVKDKVLFAYSASQIPISNITTLDFTITDESNFIPITLDEVVIDKLLYQKAKQITSFNDGLYLGDLEEYKEANLQLEVNKLQFKWVSELSRPFVVNTNPNNKSDKYHSQNNQKRTFAHDEVYALYFRVGYYYGTSKWFHCVGREAIGTEKVNSTEPRNENLGGLFKNYQVSDTCTTTARPSLLTAEGDFSFWENENEPYPNTGYYPTGNVRHFKFPSLRWCRENLWNVLNYGINIIDRLGIKPLNIDLNNFKDCDGNVPLYYEIGYAKRGLIDTRVQGQSFGLNAQYLKRGSNDNINEFITSTGGNWRTYSNQAQDSIKDFSTTNPTNRDLRVYPFEALRENFALVSNFIRIEYLLNTKSRILQSYVTGAFSEYNFVGTTAYNTVKAILSDFTDAGISFSDIVPPLNPKIYRIKNQKYVLNNTLTENQDNTYLETAINIEVPSSNNLFSILQELSSILNTDGTYIPGIGGPIEEHTFDEQTGLVSLLNIKQDYYINFVEKEIVITDSKHITNQIIWGGDSYICDYAVNTYGKNEFSYAYSYKSRPSNPLYNGDVNYDDKWNGVKACHRFLCESKFNINLRHTEYSTEFEKYTSYYPNISGNNVFNFLNILERDIDPNNFQVGYNPDFHQQNIIEFDRIFDWKKEYDFVKPNRIITSGILNNEFNVNTWKDWKVNNYYDLINNRGRLINLEANKDFIYIHFEKELLRTIGRLQLQINEKELTVGSGDIFRNIPEPIIHDNLGYLGTQHKWSCLATPFGYSFFDSEKGVWWLIENGNKPVPISADGMHNFFREQEFAISDNPFTSYGIVSYFDEFHKRLIVTNKNQILKEPLKSRFKGVWKAEQKFIDSLKTGDVVIKNGKYVIVS